MLENSPVGESRSNGLTEKAIQEVQGTIRTLKDCVESKLIDKETGEKGTTTLNGAVITWSTERSGHIIIRYKIGPDGMTAYQRLKGKK